ncbi:MAG TPA: tetratricopeptide repeat protein [Vicinamibacterales bacterium]|nr:tetratricopeptide repeat protein [Vicinamibacterales bacterium]
MIELRRRVQSDPASIAFAQLAEEYRRAGQYDDAVKCCRTGLARHPGYLSARVTLGRALTELSSLDDAEREFDLVLRTAPDNLAAIRSMAEIHQRRGDLPGALEYYKRAMALARHDPELEETVGQINRELIGVTPKAAPTGLSFLDAIAVPEPPVSVPVAPKAPLPDGPQATPEPPRPPAPVPVEEPAPDTSSVDFDALLRSLGLPDATPPPVMEMWLTEPPVPVERPEPVLPELPLDESAGDPFAALERELRAFDAPPRQAPPLETAAPRAMPSRDAAPEAPPLAPSAAAPAAAPSADILNELEAWLTAIHQNAPPSA